MKRTCKANPQLPPHSHHRENGMLVCTGYKPFIEKQQKEKGMGNVNPKKGYVPE